MWMKIWGAILIGTLFVIFSCDTYTVKYLYTKSGRGIEQSIDAGIIEAGIVTDAQQGTVTLDENILKNAVKREFIRYMNLDSMMENAYMKNSQLDMSISYDSNGNPWIQVEFRTHISYSIRDISYPLTLSRRIAYESTYI
ncbi:hypothetical protein GC101_18095 [Paenibacillus sp. LMG 31459]|uniref:Uncharacterized protein n=1 Tax=Paenibacillus phytohabitans TaxID=2654978 RepID=A0ABX1YID7_9BACL|nr:hypothetical protein [Paenibacillus phytohabitans]NOU80777.1 hypothetical protein [Paenibacillus phytohabitans]